MNTRKWLTIGVVVGLLAGSPFAVMSHGKAKGIVLERHNVMSDIGKAMKRVGAMVKGKRPLDRADVAKQADIISDRAAQIEALFPDTKQSRQGAGSTATPAVWSEKERFNAISFDLVEAAKSLSKISGEAAESEIKQQFRQLGATCKSCHKDYRKKKKQH